MLGNSKNKILELRADNTDQSHVGRGIITLDRASKEFLGVTSGDIVELEANRKTAAIIWPAKTSDEGRGIIRMDSLIRKSCGVSLGEKVKVSKAIFQEAKKVILAPLQEVRNIASGYDRIVKKNFIGRPMNKGDYVLVPVFGRGLIFTVAETSPKGLVKVNDLTQFVLKDKPAKEIPEISRVTYDDVGGLEKQIKKVRELIELPMGHPELFIKLGINPPKGVLLYGPPGTGKTLLAKAVASETQAHFIPVSAPQIMCVGGNTQILTNPQGTETVKKLFDKGSETGKIINNGTMQILELKNPFSTYSLNNKLKIVKGKITHITKLKAKSFRIKTNFNDDITVSANQPFALIDCFGNLVWKPAKEIKKGDLVAIAKNIPQGRQFKFDYLNDFDADSTWIKTASKIIKLVEFKGKLTQVKQIKIAKQNCNFERASWTILPKKTSPKLMRLLGLMYSEGYISKDGIDFANIDPVLRKEFSLLVKKLFGLDAKPQKTKICVHSYTLKHFFEKTLSFPKNNKRNYVLPKWVFGLTKKETASFIQGFWEGDGTVSKGTEAYPTIRIYAASKPVLQNLSVLSKKIGLLSKIVSWKTKISDVWALVFVGNKSRELFAEQIKSNVKKYSLILDWYSKRIKKGDDMGIPDIAPLLKQIKQTKNLSYGRTLPEGPAERYISGRAPLTHRKLKEIQKLLKTNNPKVKALVEADVAWAKIESINKQDKQELFDLTVDSHNNFVAGSSLMLLHNSKFVGEAEERIRQIFKEAEENAPSIIFIDEIDAIAPKREEVLGEVERRVVAQLLSAMDGMEARGNVIVIAATNRVNSLDEALRRPGRFDREIEIGVPNKEERKSVLQIHTRGMPLTKEDKKDFVDLDYFASITHGFVGADLAALAKESAMKALSRYLPEINLEEDSIPPKVLESLEVNKQDFLDALKEVQPSALREVLIEIPTVKWTDVGALDEVKEELKQAVEWPLKKSFVFKKMGITPPKGVLLYGPPGTGKTLLAKAVATESQANFISIKGPELVSKWVGETEKGIRKIFKKAKQVSPAIVFFDEIDSIAGSRGSYLDSGVGDRALNQLLTELNGIEDLKDVVFIAATNRPDLVDSGLIRPGRIDKLILVPAPDENARKEIFRIHLRGVLIKQTLDINELAKKTDGFSGADIEGLVREAALICLKENKMESKPVELKHFLEALKKIRPSISKESQESYEEFAQHYSVFKPKYVE